MREGFPKKIPHTGDTDSLDRCGKKHRSRKLKKMSHVMRHLSHVTCHMSHITCHMSPVTCDLSCVTCHISLTSSAIATDPPCANFPTRHSRVVCKDSKIQFFLWVIFGRFLTVFGIIWTIFHFPVEFWPVYDRFQPFSTFLGLILIIGDQIG